MKKLLFVLVLVLLVAIVAAAQTPRGAMKPLETLGTALSAEEAHYYLERIEAERQSGYRAMTVTEPQPQETPAQMAIIGGVLLSGFSSNIQVFTTVTSAILVGSVVIANVNSLYGGMTIGAYKIDFPRAPGDGSGFVFGVLPGWVTSVEIFISSPPDYQMRRSILPLYGYGSGIEIRTVAESEEGRWLWLYGDFNGEGQTNFLVDGLLIPKEAIALFESKKVAIDLWKTEVPMWPSGTYMVTVQKGVWNRTLTFSHQQTKGGGARG